MINKNASKTNKIGSDLKRAGETIGPKQFLLKRIIFAAGFALLAFAITVGALAAQSRLLTKEFAGAFDTSYIHDENMRQQMEDFGNYYAENRREFFIANGDYDRAALVEDIKITANIKKDQYAEIMADVLIERFKLIDNNYFKWVFLIIIYMVGLFGYYLPYIFLRHRINTIQAKMEDEVEQFNTVILMLMHVNNMSLLTILEWMEKFAVCFKDSIADCITAYAVNEEKALKMIKEQEYYEPLHRLVDNMLVVDKRGLVNAFDDVSKERLRSKDKRDEKNKEQAEKLRGIAELISFIPLGVELGLYLLYPMLKMAASYQDMMGQIVK